MWWSCGRDAIALISASDTSFPTPTTNSSIPDISRAFCASRAVACRSAGGELLSMITTPMFLAPPRLPLSPMKLCLRMYLMVLGTDAAWYSRGSNISRSLFLSCPDCRLRPGTARQSRGTRPMRTLSLAMSNSWMRSRMKRSVFSVSPVRASGGSEKTTSAGLVSPHPATTKQQEVKIHHQILSILSITPPPSHSNCTTVWLWIIRCSLLILVSVIQHSPTK